MEWGRLAESHPTLLLFAGGVLGSMLTLLSSRYVARLGFRTEVMRLRHSIAERRMKEFDGAAGDLWRMMLGIAQGDAAARWRFYERYPSAYIEVLLAAGLVMMPRHAILIGAVQNDLSSLYRRLYTAISEAEEGGVERPDEVHECAIRAMHALSSLMQGVDISAEARLEGRSSRLHTAGIEGIAMSFVESQEQVSGAG